MKITKEEIQKKTQEKATAIQTLCKQLEVVISAEQMITEKGFIKNAVYYTDTEKYDVEEQLNPKTDEIKNTTPNVEKTTLEDKKV